MLKYITYVNNRLLREIYYACCELYQSGVNLIINEISKEIELEGTVISLEFKRDPNCGIDQNFHVLINRVFGNQFNIQHDPESNLYKLHIGDSIISPMDFKLDGVEYL